MASMSREKRFSIRPIGFVSKKLIGWWRTDLSMSSWRRLDADNIFRKTIHTKKKVVIAGGGKTNENSKKMSFNMFCRYNKGKHRPLFSQSFSPLTFLNPPWSQTSHRKAVSRVNRCYIHKQSSVPETRYESQQTSSECW